MVQRLLDARLALLKTTEEVEWVRLLLVTNPPERTWREFWDRVDIRSVKECWIREGKVSETGQVRFKTSPAPRWLAQQLYGNLGRGWEVYSTCKNKRCVNPTHLLPECYRYRPRKNIARTNLEVAAKLLSKCKKEGDCMIWQGQKQNAGYGTIHIDGRRVLVHRLSFLLCYGRLPHWDLRTVKSKEDSVIRHLCHTPLCINPLHLKSGTPKDNVHDAVESGRHSHGEKHPDAKLTTDDVIAIRVLAIMGFSPARIGETFNISSAHAGALIRGKRWKHVS